eukprot:PhF_6_TR11016/c0_g1_i2/m.17840
MSTTRRHTATLPHYTTTPPPPSSPRNKKMQSVTHPTSSSHYCFHRLGVPTVRMRIPHGGPSWQNITQRWISFWWMSQILLQRNTCTTPWTPGNINCLSFGCIQSMITL